MENRIFKYALITSVFVHSFIFVVLLLTDIRYHKDLQELKVEVVYQVEVLEKKAESQKSRDLAKGLKENKKIALPKIPTRSDETHPPMFRDAQKRPAKLELPKKTDAPMKDFLGKRQIKIPVLDSDKMIGSRYMTYHEQVREKIRNRAYFYVDDPQFESGEVYLTFALGSDGSLKAIKIIHEKTCANNYLRSVGLRSIKESAPFPPFPKDLNYPELTFNVVISFEVGE